MCETHMVVKALANDIEPHCTTISNFVSTMSEESGTKKALEKKYERIKKITKKIIAEHKKQDIKGTDEEAARKKKLKRMNKDAKRILEFLSSHEKRIGAGREEVKMNITDNESGKIKGLHGMIQGYYP
ncbi:hypothetical protein AGMMS49546_33180 [Spirochaetia bacterium]|nr:hypothetical protein AGMMS49546_33180 [Spirochaetia bacterium]